MTQTYGLVDLQVNGYAGIDFNDASITAEALDHALHNMLRSGVTTCLPTLITAGETDLAARLLALDSAVATSRFGPSMVPGFHLEGPFLNPTPGYAGCHPAGAMVHPDPTMLTRLTRGLRRPVLLLTLAPEQPGALDVVRWAVARGTVVAMGHTAATAEDVRQAVAAGITLSTHLGNALPQPQPKFFNPLMAQLAEDGLHASFIADGIHIPPAALKVMLRAKGIERSILVTDATAAAAAPPGSYRFAGMAIDHRPDGSVRVPGGEVLAGSALCLDQAVRNLIAWDLVSPEAAIAMASTHPRAILAATAARCTTGIVTWSDDWHVVRTELGALHISAE